MIQYNTLNAKLSNSQLNKSKSGLNNVTQVTINIYAIDERNDNTHFPHKLLLTNT